MNSGSGGFAWSSGRIGPFGCACASRQALEQRSCWTTPLPAQRTISPTLMSFWHFLQGLERPAAKGAFAMVS